MALTSLLDSEATFAQKATDGGLSEPYIDALKRNSVATFAKLSFAIMKSGETAAETQVNTFLTTVRPGVNPTIADLAAFKRLLFESQTIMIQNARSAVKGDEQGPQRMPQPEREARLTRMKRELRSIDISGPLEPAHSLYDMCFETIEKNQIAHINPNRRLSRQQELSGSKPEKELQLDASKTGLVVQEKQSHQELNLSSDLALYQALQRRSLAFELSGLASYEVINKWMDRLFSMYSQVPAPGFRDHSATPSSRQAVFHSDVGKFHWFFEVALLGRKTLRSFD